MSEPAAVGPSDNGPLAVICGGGSLPFAVADAVAGRGRRVVLFAVRGWADPQRVARYPHHWAVLGKFGWFCRVAQQEGCREIVLIGTMLRPPIWRIRPDIATLRLLPRIMHMFRGGDDHLLSTAAKVLEEHGFRLIGAHEIAPEILMPEGLLGTVRPIEADQADIAKAFALLDAASPFDVGQAAVVANARVLAVEAAEGTDQMLARVAELRRGRRIAGAERRGVLVKAAKRGQDRRMDLPSIGPRTIEGVAQAGLAGIAVVAGSTILAEPERIAAIADREGVFVLGTSEPIAAQ